MKQELEQQLVSKYPLIFSRPCEISCGDGWYTLIDTLCNTIQGHILSVERQRNWALEKNKAVPANHTLYDVPELVEQVSAQQIKEKFGTLRFYVTGGDRYIYGAIQMADSMSGHICEDCGNLGSRRGGTWIRTLCDQHYVKTALGASDQFLA